MRAALKSSWEVVRDAASAWVDDKSPRMGAALAFYTIFSISPLFVIVIAIARLTIPGGGGETELFDQVKALVGEEGGEAIQSLVAKPEDAKSGLWATALAGFTLILGATTVFAQLQDALNSIWRVKPKPGRGVIEFVQKRILSFAMILAIGFLLLVSLVLSAGLAAVGKWAQGFVPGTEFVGQSLNFIASFAVITVLLAMIFKIMPDVKIAWKDVWAGAAFTALLFALGKLAIGMYLGRSSVTSAYGAAGSMVVVLLWVYYSAQIMFFGAEMTQVYARRYGTHVVPSKNAVEITACEAVPDRQHTRRKTAATR